MKLNFIIPVILILISSIGLSQDSVDIKQRKEFSIGEILTINSNILDEARVLNVYLPLSYHPDSLNKYPVIYLLDGSAHEDFIHIAGLVQFGSYPWLNKVPESIVVGIENVDRKKDFTFIPNDTGYFKNTPTAGNSEKFISFLKNEVQVIIDKTYRTTAEKTLIGQSLGGLLATEVLFFHTDMFNNYIIISPSLWWDRELLLRSNIKLSTLPDKVYVGVGKEGRIMESEAKKLYRLLKKQGMIKSQLKFNYFKDCDHADVLHLAVYDAFNVLFNVVE
ncbi:alpha/beta hydrolase [Crocinitomix catalasitica]|uniref:alpha/beta hydrolase n=1 Tax=Crocinitomix catalasitica TaxID=184607 RepID=UPI000565E357|nr:alpha/beta hydrolase-fold protein [Crocinitomix catalasitica]